MRNGFSLLELSVVLIIISLIAAFGFTAGQNAVQGADRVATQERLATIKTALDNYAAQYGYLPCPANRNLTPSSSNFGVEARSGTSCTASGDLKSLPPSPSTPVIYLGGVPVRTLGLPDAYAADAWSDKLLYAVSLSHVGSAGAYMGTDGAITIKRGDRTGTNYTVTTSRSCTAGANCTSGAMATYVVLSHGPDGKGAYPLYGTTVATPCGSSAADDVSNCDETNALSSTDNAYHAVFYDTDYNDTAVNTASFFDDYIVWGSNALSRSPKVLPVSACYGTVLSSSGSGVCQNTISGCDAACLTAGYSSGGPVMNNCSSTNVVGCTNGVACDYQCCCTGTLATPSNGCAAQLGISWTVGIYTCTGDLTAPLANGANTTISDGAAGVSGSVTLTCNSGTLTQSAASCASGSSGGCTGGSCDSWCAPCRNPGGLYMKVCQKVVVSSSPCEAQCTWSGCPMGQPCVSCP